MYVIGIDGGGTQTTGIVSDEFGRVHMYAKTGRSNPNTMNRKEFAAVMADLLQTLSLQNPVVFEQVSCCFAGLAGVGESGKDEEVAHLLRDLLPDGASITVRNDAFNALYSGTLGKAGIVQIAGTGAITFGINDRGETARSGGWGYLFDDEGSGFYLGNEALRHIFKAHDERGPSTSLSDRVLHHFSAASVPDVISSIYGEEHPRSVIAPLSRYVVEEATAGDGIAQTIIEAACEKMIESIVACRQQLFDEEHATTIILSGGVFTGSDLCRNTMIQFAGQCLPSVTLQSTQVPPAVGAVLAGLSVMQIKPENEFVSTLTSELNRKGLP
ncbi:N-acetylmuramic acid/N-acetylglucosamine kinase [Sporosarcina sp. NCCP-2222]|uniref:N-acetylglucosamine kinase n=1 Tax=Sporosarcina sp. NCCP-2222 TaxID=2935073 RepID=UPI002084BD07|nr:BadF/BadG/BcrA/BcrD ATPase family protein [Sporosarcina sp. NCCP-2222]GKV56848.1 N-acetylmuramic acid/N-acetylglucosamine kinase [Sporosarcina sp. NCCP-2222]